MFFLTLSVAHKELSHWKFTSDGNFSVMHGYFQALGNDSTQNASSSSVNGDLWRKLWKIPTAPKCLNLAWRACQNILPNRVNLKRRGVDVDFFCPRCGQESETELHALLLCEESNMAWFASPLEGRMDVL